MVDRKSHAHYMVRKALKQGKLARCPCENCGRVDRVHAHHDDYYKPLVVRWLCPKCHAIEDAHKRRLGWVDTVFSRSPKAYAIKWKWPYKVERRVENSEKSEPFTAPDVNILVPVATEGEPDGHAGV